MGRRAFTLIELLIVVAIIAILAAIALPNFLCAQVRAKASRVRADLRTIATALESYANDWNDYPLNDGVYNVIPLELTTPVAYLTNATMVDPFCVTKLPSRTFGERERYYTYTRPVTPGEVITHSAIGHAPPIEAVEAVGGWPGNPHVFEKYGRWRLVSNGPDMSYPDTDYMAYLCGTEPITDPNCVLLGSDVSYDPTNGCVSEGNIVRTQLSPDGKICWP